MNKIPKKFKVWDIEANQFLSPLLNGTAFVNSRGKVESLDYYLESTSFYKVYQFTGMFDSKGVEIYEGDIIRSEVDYDKDDIAPDGVKFYEKFEVVQYKNGIFYCDEDDICSLFLDAEYKTGCYEVVGHIGTNTDIKID